MNGLVRDSSDSADTRSSGVPGGGVLRLGTRGSALAMVQAEGVARRLEECADVRVEVAPIQTAGDRHRGHLGELGGKGAFLREIDRALVTGAVDVAVHCLKDVPGDVPRPEELVFAAYLKRDDTSDVMLFPRTGKVERLEDLPLGARVGTSAVRRRAQLLQLRPDLQVEYLRGNVDSRLGRLDAGDCDAIVVARAGLRRLGIDRAGEALDIVPAIGAGVLAVNCRRSDRGVVELVRLLDDRRTRECVAAERAMLRELRGHCNSPIAGHARYEADGRLSLRGMVFTRDGAEFVRAQRWSGPDAGEELGLSVAGDLLRKGARELIDDIPHP
ncbi:hydroxymethylbilane synthase [Actinomadura barringtoniae]|uniref:Porphobilinogen deaminase n=1 Tax=Actinomadura barringtoniae TaxID=1427535 RepID=A0A939P6T5_9ACTN|nr:hydroxymethylbilane synthase [Actinomadura barringtoniae]MBO2446636.1 hydroxymethylbilane synthase [Actinomadura barringtoniae]